MHYTEIMVRYGELSTKGKNRKDFIRQLGRNVRAVLHRFPRVEVKAQRDRLHVALNGEDDQKVISILQGVFGIETLYPSIRVEKDMAVVKQTALQMAKEQYHTGETFKINTRRQDKHFEYHTNQINNILGDYVLENIDGISVDVKHPDIAIRVEVRMNGVFLSSETIHGAGGLPVGTGGRATMMLSGGIDSPVATYLAMKRGVKIDMIHFYSPPYTSEQALNKAKQLTSVLAKYSGNIQFIQVPFTEIQETIKEKVPEGYLMTIQRRMMLRIAAEITKNRHCTGVFTGEALGQVASQTLESMLAINDVTNMPVLRPLVSMDKTEIIKISKQIGTYDLSIMPFEDCCTIFTPPAPKTKPNLQRSREFENYIDVADLMKKAIEHIQITDIKPGEEFMNQDADVFAELL
ncbi:tRNA uracil 4-sulfurtransferase ThiI [Lentilactobacillus farraginis]|uniref:Probable tRNA sulfurtransferase n=1 Tax=Lentilactobacillus farraginis DSM 18382 = JCM 14108 TaxID=1423743 RepID=X0PET1_9LACO|nr:tRNA uracil 4-sulfurtransferase ThiI [Lentilactobacillus farraginis]KRM10080.1 thiamine-phosphate kinase [Lentilactobacillus farraginis DSM 18382 = JCM 14108]GAF35237.1 tRNA S(4)U 4-thiouridine synthase [Lentilactobacillus farraginis DSM 18382 = JCM 14108]